jgi:glucose-1-phosphate cytidylyltransferase
LASGSKPVEKYLRGKAMFLADYSDGLSDAPLPAIIESFEGSGNIACLVSVKPRVSFHLFDASPDGAVNSIAHVAKSGARINDGYMVLR